MESNISVPSIEENTIRREKQRQTKLFKDITKMKAALPKYTLNDIRQYKLPYYQAMLLELQESGYVNSEAYLSELFDFQDRMKEEAGPYSTFWNLPVLKYSNNELEMLCNGLKRAEDEHRKGNFRSETEIILKIGIDLSFNNDQWYWLGEQIILKCILNAETFKTTGKHEAISRYAYAKLLIEKVKDFETAESQLNIARELSAGKSWHVSVFFPGFTDCISMACSYLLHFCLMKSARSWMKVDCRKAIEYAMQAQKRASEACYHDGETEAFLIKGQCELDIQDTKAAISTFNKAYYIQSRLGSEKGMCEARVELSKAYLMHGNTDLALQNLLRLKEKAEKFNLNFYLAQAYRYLGEYYLNSGEPSKATPLLSDALRIFHEGGHNSEADQVRNLGALSAGLELMFDYLYLISNASRECPNWIENLIKLVEWKDSRKPFWNESKSIQALTVSFEDAVAESSIHLFRPPENNDQKNVHVIAQTEQVTDSLPVHFSNSGVNETVTEVVDYT